MALSNETLIELYRKMLLTRFMETKHKELLKKGKMFLMAHLGTGQEAVAVGVSAPLGQDDILFPTHRGLGEFIGKGMNPLDIWMEYLGKKTGLCKGKGTLHLTDRKHNIAPVISCLGSNASMAVGTALASKMRRSNQITVFFVGEGAFNQGDAGPSMCMAALWKLPLVFAVCSNEFCGRSHRSSHIPTRDVAPRASGYGIPFEVIDGQDIETTYETTTRAVAYARCGKGPYLIEYRTFRIAPHHTGDRGEYVCDYVNQEQLDHWKRRDPLDLCMRKLEDRGILTTKQEQNIREDVQREADRALEHAVSCPDPIPEELFTDVAMVKGVVD